MRIFAAVLAITLILLQGRLWFSDKGLREVSGLKASVETQRAANLEQTERNRQLSAEVSNLKTGLTALESGPAVSWGWSPPAKLSTKS